MELINLLPLFSTLTKSQEILLLLHDTKAVVRQGFYPQEISRLQQFCRKNGLSLAISKFKVLLAAGEKEYSNKGLRIPEHDPRPGMYFVYFSKEEKKALLASYYELIGNDRDLGLLLGYPECCVNFFVENFSENKTDLEFPPTNLYTNLSKRGEDYVLLSHFPCSSECAASIELAKRYLHVLEKVEVERARQLLLQLTPGQDTTPG